MKLVLDNNSLFSIMNPDSTSAYLFSSIRAEFIAPEFIRSEFKKHRGVCLAKSCLSEHEFESRRIQVECSIKFFKASLYEKFLAKAFDLISDRDDVDFLALALFTRAAIWSNDPHLKEQSLVKVFTTSELLELFIKGEI